MEYEVLSPQGDVDPIRQIALNPRVPDLNSATIGLFASFKQHWVIILDEIAKQNKITFRQTCWNMVVHRDE